MKFSAHKNRFTFAILSERPCSLVDFVVSSCLAVVAAQLAPPHQCSYHCSGRDHHKGYKVKRLEFSFRLTCLLQSEATSYPMKSTQQ